MTGQTRYTALIQQVATAYGLDVDLLEAQVIHESSGEPDAFKFEAGFYHNYVKGKPHALAGKYGPLAACSCGLLQIMLETAMERGFADRPEMLFVDRVGLTFGAKYLHHLLMIVPGDMPLALARYNGGPAVKRPFNSTIAAYVNTVYQIAGKLVPQMT